jgi:hypothetical protein
MTGLSILNNILPEIKALLPEGLLFIFPFPFRPVKEVIPLGY